VIISHSRARHARVALLDSERGKHTGRDLVPDSYRPKNVDHVLEMASIMEGKDCIAFADGIDEAMLRWVSDLPKAAHPHALSVYERVSGGLALTRHRTKGEHYPLTRGRNVNILI
jgi:hypothetical protein